MLFENSKNKEIRLKIEKSLEYSIKDGCFWAIMFGFGDSFISAFGLFLGGTAFQITLLTSIPQLLSALSQLLAIRLTNYFKTRKTIVILGGLVQATIWPIIIILSFTYKSVNILILLYSIILVSGMLANPAWASWMGDLVRKKSRGAYFGKRNRIIGFTSFMSLYIAGLILDAFSKIDTFAGFSILFIIAFIGRLISLRYMSLKYEPLVKLRKLNFSASKFIKIFKTSSYGKFARFNFFFMFSVFLANPLIVFYWMKYLNFSYSNYTALVAFAAISSFITISYWGKWADKYGNKKILEVSSFLICILPAFWFLTIFLSKPYSFFFALIIQTLSGFSWAGFNQASGNYLYDLVKPKNRVSYIAMFNLIKGLGLFLGASIGGIITLLDPTKTLKIILAITLISFVLCYFVYNVYAKKMDEVRKVEQSPSFIHFVTIMPIQGMAYETIYGMNRTLRRFREKLEKIEENIKSLKHMFKF